MPHRLDHFPWCFGGPLWDFRRRNQTGFRGVRKRLFTFSRGVHGIEPIENANFQVINRDTSREAKTRGQGQRNERNPTTDPQLVLSVRDAGFLSGELRRIARVTPHGCRAVNRCFSLGVLRTPADFRLDSGAGSPIFAIAMPVLLFIEPCLPSPGDRPPSGSNWIHGEVRTRQRHDVYLGGRGMESSRCHDQ
jgi:hypothetical protein